MLVSAKTKVVLIDRLFSKLDQVSLAFVQEWLESYTGIIILFGEHAEYFNAVKTPAEDQQLKSKTEFNSVFSFLQMARQHFILNSNDGFVKTLNPISCHFDHAQKSAL